MISLPSDFLQNMQQLLQSEYENFLKEYDKPYYKGLRVNTNKISCGKLQELMPQLKDRIPYCSGFYIDADCKLGNSPFHHAGLFYSQEPSAMQPALATEIEKGSVVLDLCASPGGKSGQLAEQIGDTGVLVSNEIITNRAKILKENMDRLGYANVIVTSTTVENLTRLGKLFDVILVDAPCSGEGLFRKEPNAISEWNVGINKMNHDRQLQILKEATKLLKSGGKIIYSTCTFSAVENEQVVDNFLEQNSNFILGKINSQLIENSTYLQNENLRRVLPHKNKGEGQFYAVLQNTDEKEIDNKRYVYLDELKSSERQLVKEFIAKYTTLENITPKSYEGNILLPPVKEINTKSIFVLKYGINLGKIERNRFVPNHNFFTSLGDKFKIQINIENEEQIKKYLRGEQIQVENQTDSGYCAVCYQGFTVGGGKIQNGAVNNLYPKYLRIN